MKIRKVGEMMGKLNSECIIIPQSVNDHTIIGFTKPFKPREAWEWILFETNHEGSFSHSIQFLETTFGWSQSKTEDFIRTLETEKLITTTGSQNTIHISVADDIYLNPLELKTDPNAIEITEDIIISQNNEKATWPLVAPRDFIKLI